MKWRIMFGAMLLLGMLFALSWLPPGNSRTSSAAPSECASLSFTPPVNYAVSALPSGITTADFNEDGFLDMVVVVDVSGAVSILLGNGDGTFQSAVPVLVGTMPNSVAADDFNEDGHLDIAVTLAQPGSTSVSILLGIGDGTFQSGVTYSAVSQPGSIATGDFNEDANVDLAVASIDTGELSILPGNGDGTFQAAVPFPVGSGLRSVRVADFNGDADLDIVVVNYSSLSISILLGNGDGTFDPAVAYPVGSQPTSIAVGDFNTDTYLDLAVSHGNISSTYVSVMLGNGNGTFQTSVSVTVGSGPRYVEATDFNGDGNLDLAVAADLSAGTVVILEGNGDGSFEAPATFPASYSAMSLATGDFNGDARPDLVVSIFSSNVAVMINDCAQQIPESTGTVTPFATPPRTGTPPTFTATRTATPTRFVTATIAGTPPTSIPTYFTTATRTPFWLTSTPTRFVTVTRTGTPPTATATVNRPVNDHYYGAIVVSPLPFTDSRDTTNATTAADDPYCYTRLRTVWYRFVPSANVQLEVNTFGSNYDTTLGVYTGQPPYLWQVACSDDSYSPPSQQSQIRFTAYAGQTYYFMVAADTGALGGNLVFNASVVLPPPNDDFNNATVISTLPFVDARDIGAATGAFDDPYSCRAGGGTVWYSYTPTSDMRVEVDTTGSTYFAYVGVFTGSRGALTQVSCAWSSVHRFDVAAGQTYYFMVTAGAYGYSTQLNFALRTAPPALAVDITADRFGTVSPTTGEVTVRGTVTCNRPAYVYIWGDIQQKLGQGLINGYLNTSVYCDGTTAIAWSSTAYSEPGAPVGGGRAATLFTGGRAAVNLYASAQGTTGGDYANDTATATVTLRGAP